MADFRILVEADNGATGIENGVFVEPAGAFDVALSFPGGTIAPGLINAHDHLHRNHYGRLGAPPYADARAWGQDIERRYAAAIEAGRRVPRREALLTGAWKNLFAGVTTVVHHDRWEADFDADFPLRVVRVICADSIRAIPAVGADEPYCVHLAEGVGAASADEVRALHARGLLDARLLAVHGLGMDAAAIELFRASGAALAWCPTSNRFLFGRTAPPRLLAGGVDVLLGSDSLLSGEGDLLDELRAARRLGLMSDRRLADAVGETAARRLGIAAPSIEPGRRADLVVLAAPMLEARASDVELVVAAGVPRLARPDLGERLARIGLRGRPMTLRGVSRWTHGPVPGERPERARSRPAMNQTALRTALPEARSG